MKFHLKQAVCIHLGSTAKDRQWVLGVVIHRKDAGYYQVEVPYEENPEPKRRLQGEFLWCGSMLLPSDLLWLLFSRVSSKTFLVWLEEGKVMARRATHIVHESQLCEADSQTLWKRIFPNG